MPPAPRQYAVLGPLTAAAEARAFLGCEVIGGAPRSDLPVVIVWLPDELTRDPKQVARLQRETAFVTQLRHPNIVRVYGLECFEEGWARVLAHVDAEPLSRLFSRARELGQVIPPALAGRIILDACEGVRHAHEEGQARWAGRPIVHGAIRSDTVFIGFDGLTMIAGFGAAQTATHHNTGRERYAYLAPEQIIGGKATASPATDIYALGAVLYELLTGKAPFVDATDIERAVLTGEPPSIEEPGLIGRLGNIAATALSKRGSDRFESVAAMKDAILTAFGDELPASAEEVASLAAELMPYDSPERASPRQMLESAHDPDSVTILSRPTATPEGVDTALFEASRPGPISGVNAALDPSEVAALGAEREPVARALGEARIRIAIPREEKTVVDGRLPQSMHPVPALDEHGGREEVTAVTPASGPGPFGAIPRAPVDEAATEAEQPSEALQRARALEEERAELAAMRGFADAMSTEEVPARSPVEARAVPNPAEGLDFAARRTIDAAGASPAATAQMAAAQAAAVSTQQAVLSRAAIGGQLTHPPNAPGSVPPFAGAAGPSPSQPAPSSPPLVAFPPPALTPPPPPAASADLPALLANMPVVAPDTRAQGLGLGLSQGPGSIAAAPQLQQVQAPLGAGAPMVPAGPGLARDAHGAPLAGIATGLGLHPSMVPPGSPGTLVGGPGGLAVGPGLMPSQPGVMPPAGLMTSQPGVMPPGGLMTSQPGMMPPGGLMTSQPGMMPPGGLGVSQPGFMAPQTGLMSSHPGMMTGAPGFPPHVPPGMMGAPGMSPMPGMMSTGPGMAGHLPGIHGGASGFPGHPGMTPVPGMPSFTPGMSPGTAAQGAHGMMPAAAAHGMMPAAAAHGMSSVPQAAGAAGAHARSSVPATQPAPARSTVPAPTQVSFLAAAAEEAKAQAPNGHAASHLPKPPVPGAVPRAPMREESAITAFDRKAGDSSRSVLVFVLAGVVALGAGIFYYSEPPPEVQQAAEEEVRHNLPKDLVRSALEKAGQDKPPEEAAPPEEVADPAADPAAAGVQPGSGAKPGEVATEPPPPVERFGRLELSSDPEVDVYLGNELLGRTPLTAKLETGSQRLRFTDKKTGLNAYKSFRVRGGALTREHVSFGTSELIIEAPEGASVLLNQRFIGKAPLDVVKVYEGRYHLKVTLDGKSWADVFDAPPGRQIKYQVKLNN